MKIKLKDECSAKYTSEAIQEKKITIFNKNLSFSFDMKTIYIAGVNITTPKQNPKSFISSIT